MQGQRQWLRLEESGTELCVRPTPLPSTCLYKRLLLFTGPPWPHASLSALLPTCRVAYYARSKPAGLALRLEWSSPGVGSPPQYVIQRQTISSQVPCPPGVLDVPLALHCFASRQPPPMHSGLMCPARTALYTLDTAPHLSHRLTAPPSCSCSPPPAPSLPAVLPCGPHHDCLQLPAVPRRRPV